MSALADVGRLLLLLAGLLLPGAAVLRALRLPRSPALCFAGSAVAIYVVVLGLSIGSVRLSLASLATTLGAITAAAWWLGRESRPPTAGAAAGVDARTPLLRMGGWTPLYLLFWAVIFYRAWHEPLAGPDVEFRWSYLAEQMLRLGSLDFYPPRSAGDFLSYFWVESIPPGVAGLYAWAYACAGGVAPLWTVPIVLLQFWGLHELVWRLADDLGGVRAARLACIVAAACPLLNWSLLIAQETGLTALALLGIVYALRRWQADRTAGWAVVAGLFAALGAATREYGLVFPVLAIGGFLCARADRRALAALLIAMIPISLAWPAIVAARTGNPFYSLDVGGWLPVNPLFATWLEHHRALLADVIGGRSFWLGLVRYLGLFAPSALLGWLAIATRSARGDRAALLLAAMIAVVLALWFAALPYTMGGLFYSLRVTSPALALAAVAAGGLLAALPVQRWPRTANLAIGLALVATLPSTLALPQHAWGLPSLVRADRPPPAATVLAEALLALPAPGVVVADAPGHQAHVAARGGRVIPPWSPQAAWLFVPDTTAAELARRFRAAGIRYLLLSDYPPHAEFFRRRARWNQPPFHLQPLLHTELATLYELRLVGE